MGAPDLRNAEHKIVPDAVVSELYQKMLGVYYADEFDLEVIDLRTIVPILNK